KREGVDEGCARMEARKRLQLRQVQILPHVQLIEGKALMRILQIRSPQLCRHTVARQYEENPLKNPLYWVEAFIDSEDDGRRGILWNCTVTLRRLHISFVTSNFLFPVHHCTYWNHENQKKLSSAIISCIHYHALP